MEWYNLAMPELPEVETIKLGLQKKIIGLKIKKIEVRSPKSFLDREGKPFDYAQGLRGRKVLNLWRRAKILGLELGGSQKTEDGRRTTLLFHLKMTGQLIYEDGQRLIGGHPTSDMAGPMPSKHTRVIFEFSNGGKLYFNDQRKFGWVKVISFRSWAMSRELKELGPEPLEKDFTWEVLKNNLLRHKSQPVKVTIMDQKVVSGVGNIYANEACFNAGIDPRTKVAALDDEHFKKLYQGIIKSLQDGIKHGGSTRAHFVDPEGRKGYFLDYAYVYGKEGQKCKKCGAVIKKITLGGRGTYLCPICQK